MTAPTPDPVETLAQVLGDVTEVSWDFFPDPNQAINDIAAAVLAAIDSGQVPGVGRVEAAKDEGLEVVRERAYVEGYEAGLLAPQSAWMRGRTEREVAGEGGGA